MSVFSSCQQRLSAWLARPRSKASLAIGVLLIAAFTLLTIGAVSADTTDVPAAAEAETPEVAAVSPLTVRVTEDGNVFVQTVPQGATVQAVLKAAGLTVGETDRLNVPLDTVVTDGLSIVLRHFGHYDRVERQVESFDTVYRYTNTLAPGKTIVYQEGQEGITEAVYRERIVRGRVVYTQKLSEACVQERQDRILLVGTDRAQPMSAAPFEVLLDENGQPVNYTQVLSGKATAYTNDRGLCGTHTSTGRLAQVGVVAVDPSIIPYGTQLYIVSPDGSYTYGYAIAGDTGGAMLSGRNLVDLFMNTYEECVCFGRRTMNVYVIG